MENFETNGQLSESELERIFFLSFMFSQGNSDLQENLLFAVSSLVGPQNQDKSEEAFNSLLAKIVPEQGKAATLEKAKIHPLVGDFANAEVYKMLATYLWRSHEVSDKDYQEILDEIWARDHEYLCTNQGRENRKIDFKPNTIQDPFFSFAIYYIEQGHDVGDTYFDLILNRLRETETSNLEIKKQVTEEYNRTHPSTPHGTNEQAST
jgi:hypothetical protein